MKKIKLFVFMLCAMFVTAMIVSADTNTLPGESSAGIITLTGDVTLNSTYNVASNKTLTIDLNGHTLKGPNSGYLIDNSGTLTIVDGGSNKGSIDCSNNTNASCIRNLSVLTVDGVKLEKSKFITIKNEPVGTLNVNNSTISIEIYGVGVENYGKAYIVGTSITGPMFGSSFGIWTISDGSSPETLIKDSTISRALIQDSLCSDISSGNADCNNSPGSAGDTLKVKIENTTTNKNIQHNYGSIEVDSVANLKKVATFATSGTEIIVDANIVTENLGLKTNVKLTLTGDTTRKIINNGDGTYTIEYIDADYTGLNGAVSVAKGLDTSKYTAESVKALLEAIEDAENVEKGLKANEQFKIDNLTKALTTAIANLVEKGNETVKPGSDSSDNTNNSDEKAPNTFDAGLTYVGLALGALSASVISVKKLRNN